MESYTFDTCKPGVACVLAFNRIEGQITDTTVRYETTPHSSKIDYLWTTNIGDHLTDVNPGDSSLRYVHVGTIALHEMGHTLGMPDFPSPYYGIMRKGASSATYVTNQDRRHINVIYRNHKQGEGW